MFPETKEWFDQADYDVETAQVMFDSGRYIYTIFMVHQAIEKALKARIVEDTRGTPPRIHNLVSLLNQSSAHLTDDYVRFISRLSMAGVSTRYPEELSRALEQYPESVTRGYLETARGVIACLKQQIE